MKEFQNFITKEKRKINKLIHSFFKSTIISEEEPSLRQFLKFSEDYVLQGGRRLHPISLVQVFLGLAPEKTIVEFYEEIYEVSISIELLHISSLMIDDLIDNEQVRRGKKTFHRLIGEIMQAKQDYQKSYEISLAIYGGNLTSLFGTRIISESNFDNTKKTRALELYLQGLSGVTRGHLLDEYYKYNVSLNQVTLENYLILADKRAKQLETAVGLGAIFGNARQSQIDPLIKAMNKIGVIEQMKNDYLGSFGNPDLNSTDYDIKSGQATILTVLAYQQGEDHIRSKLDKILGNLNAAPEDIAEVKDIYKDTGAIDFTKMYSNSLKNDAYNLINQVYPGLRSNSIDYYRNLLHYLTDFGDI